MPPEERTREDQILTDEVTHLLPVPAQPVTPPSPGGSERPLPVPTGAREVSPWDFTTPAPLGAQMAFVDEARAAMGQPSLEECAAYIGQQVTLRLSGGEVVVGMLTAVNTDEPGLPKASVTLDGRVLSLRSIESLSL